MTLLRKFLSALERILCFSKYLQLLPPLSTNIPFVFVNKFWDYVNHTANLFWIFHSVMTRQVILLSLLTLNGPWYSISHWYTCYPYWPCINLTLFILFFQLFLYRIYISSDYFYRQSIFWVTDYFCLNRFSADYFPLIFFSLVIIHQCFSRLFSTPKYIFTVDLFSIPSITTSFSLQSILCYILSRLQIHTQFPVVISFTLLLLNITFY